MSTPIRQTGAQHVNISINASPSPTSTRTMSSAAGLHERRPSDNPATASSHPLFEDSAGSSINASGAGGSALANTARWAQRFKGLVQSSAGGSAGQSWWSTRRTRGLTSTPGGSRGGRRESLHTGTKSTTSTLLHGLSNALSIFYITEEQQAYASRSHHPHSDSDSLPSSSLAASIPLPNTPAHAFPSPSPLLASTTRIPPSSPSFYYPTGKRPAALSRTGWLAVTFLFLLGLRELVVLSRMGGGATPGKGSIRVRGRDPWAVLRDYEGAKPKSSGLPGWDTLWKLPLATSSTKASGLEESNWGMESTLGAGASADTTAIVLHWKRTDNVRVIVAKLCQYEFFEGVFVWNNNPEIRLTREHFASTHCPASRLRIYNSPRNLLFTARYLACLQSPTPYCFFQDDDWIVRPLRALYSQFRRDPEGPVVVHTNEEVASLYGLEWCFFQSPLHTCFSWVGTGAFSAKSHVQRFLHTSTTINYPRDEVGHADNSFTLFQNEPPYVLTSELAQMPSPFGHSDGEGIRRNKGFIHKGLIHLTNYLSQHSPSPAPTNRISTLLHTPLPISSSPYLSSPLPPLPPHPWAHHARSPCHSDTCVFLTNINLLPPPDAIPYPGVEVVEDLETWENHLGWSARGWMEGGEGEVWKEEESWARRWSYQGAVDGKKGTAFRSPDVIKTHDYVALGLIMALDAGVMPRVQFVFVLEHGEKLLEEGVLEVEVSADGYRWFPPLTPTTPTCHPTSHTSSLPTPSFPSSTLLSPLALTLRAESLQTRWWARRPSLKECRVEMSSVLREGEGMGRGVEGWRFVRLRAGEGGERREGWGVYEMRVEVVDK